MRRSRLESTLHDYVAGDLDAAASAEIERRIAEDAGVRALCEEIRGAHEALRTLRERPEPPVSAADAFPRIQAALVSTHFEARPKLYLEGQGTRFYRRLAMAATLLLAVTVGFFALRGLAPEEQAEKTPVATPERPDPAERGLEPFVEAGRKGGIDALEFRRMLERHGLRPGDLRLAPSETVVPVAAGAPEER